MCDSTVETLESLGIKWNYLDCGHQLMVSHIHKQFECASIIFEPSRCDSSDRLSDTIESAVILKVWFPGDKKALENPTGLFGNPTAESSDPREAIICD